MIDSLILTARQPVQGYFISTILRNHVRCTFIFTIYIVHLYLQFIFILYIYIVHLYCTFILYIYIYNLYCTFIFTMIWEMWSIYSLALLPGPLWHGILVTVGVRSMGQINVLKLFVFDKTVCEKISKETLTLVSVSFDIFSHTVLSNTNNFKTFIWPIDLTPTVTSIPCQRGPGSNANE